MHILGVFIKSLWRAINLVREMILNLVFIGFVVVAIVFFVKLNNFSPTPTPMPTQGALVLNINGTIVDNVADQDRLNLVSRLIPGRQSSRRQENSLFRLTRAIRQAKDDSNITGIVLDLRNFAGADQPSLQYVGKALKEFRDNGKPIIAVSDSYSQSQYYLASFANKIWLSPQGEVDLHGFASNGLYYKSLLDKLKITTHIFRVGQYKSAVEPFIRDNMSPQARQDTSHWINILWQNYLTTVAANRRMPTSQLFPGADHLITALQKVGGDTARYALDNKLVDQLGSWPKIERALSQQFGWNDKTRQFNGVSIYDYPLNPRPQTGDAIQVIFANGTIIDGDNAPGYIGDTSLVRQIRQARLDPKVKAIVLRVNSPGGSVSASETIRDELLAAKQANKPIVVSMGGLAASGGYWIATPANYIIASPNTLTGSIGVFGVVSTFENSLDALGVHSDGVATSPLATLSAATPLTPQAQQLIQLSVDQTYQRFISLVARARHQSTQQIDTIAQGRVWTGLDAKSNGLVDQLGDFDDAVAKAAQLAKLDQWHLGYYQPESTLLDKILDNLIGTIQSALPATLQSWLPAPLHQAAQVLQTEKDRLGILNDPKHRYAFCLSCGDVH